MASIIHPLAPFWNADSEILILGTMPSAKSREMGFYYMHPQNRFWVCLAKVFNEKVPETIADKKFFLTKHKIALWDTIASCTIDGSSDASIKNVKVNDINLILDKCPIKYIYTTGKKSFELYNKYIYPHTKREAICLYSPSPANCAISLDRMVENYQIINRK